MDVGRIKAHGPWVLLRLETPVLYDGPGGPCQKSTGGIFIPATSAQDKRGYCWTSVVSVGSGKLNTKTGKRTPPDVSPGDHIWIRWYLSELNRPSIWDDGHCFIHQDDLLVVREVDTEANDVAHLAGAHS